MKTILVDCINAFVDKNSWVFQEMYQLLETYGNTKVILTSANWEQQDKFGLNQLPYPLFSLEHNPEKSDSKYYEIFLKEYELESSNVIYFEHNIDACKSAKKVGIKTYYYDASAKDLGELKIFLDANI